MEKVGIWNMEGFFVVWRVVRETNFCYRCFFRLPCLVPTLFVYCCCHYYYYYSLYYSALTTVTVGAGCRSTSLVPTLDHVPDS